MKKVTSGGGRRTETIKRGSNRFLWGGAKTIVNKHRNHHVLSCKTDKVLKAKASATIKTLNWPWTRIHLTYFPAFKKLQYNSNNKYSKI